MAEFHFLKGTFRGRLGDVVWSSWKGIDYAKTYTKPSNPKTAKQTAHRAVWGTIGHIGKQLNHEVLAKHTFPRPAKMTDYNLYVKNNGELLKANLFNPAKLVIFSGDLPGHAIKSVTYDATAKSINVEWDPSNANAEDEHDDAIVVLIQSEQVVGITTGDRQESDLTFYLDDHPDITQGPIHAYLVFSKHPRQGTAEPGMVSNTSYATITLPTIPRPAAGTPAPTPPSAAPTASGTSAAPAASTGATP